ncbi:MAG: LLM class flavin-dependent oxidoreductase [Clostridia bacterium]|nr:LLM class flavin-dependent oxidoreductase [Clostridia bacterium]
MNNNAIRNEIKSYIAASGWSLVDIVSKMNESRPEGEKTTPQNISNKLTRGTIKYSEVKEIADIIGFTITWETR